MTKRQKAAIALLAVLALLTGAIAFWPGPSGHEAAPVEMVREAKPYFYQPLGTWLDIAVGDALSQTALYGYLVHYYSIEAVEGGQVGVIMLAVPVHPDSSRVWRGALEDAARMAELTLITQPWLQGVYIVSGFDLSGGVQCSSGCTDHFFDLFVTYVAREDFNRSCPLTGRGLLNQSTWWDPYMFDFND